MNVTLFRIAGFLTLILFAAQTGFSQSNEIMNNGKAAIKAGSAKELSKYFSDRVDLSLKGEKSTYTKSHAEVLIREFFKKYPAVDFEYIHQGSSPEGLKFAIGKYSYSGGAFRVYLLIKQLNGKYFIDTLEFSEE